MADRVGLRDGIDRDYVDGAGYARYYRDERPGCVRHAAGIPLDVQLEDLDRFAKEVMPAFRPAKIAAAVE